MSWIFWMFYNCLIKLIFCWHFWTNDSLKKLPGEILNVTKCLHYMFARDKHLCFTIMTFTFHIISVLWSRECYYSLSTHCARTTLFPLQWQLKKIFINMISFYEIIDVLFQWKLKIVNMIILISVVPDLSGITIGNCTGASVLSWNH